MSLVPNNKTLCRRALPVHVVARLHRDCPARLVFLGARSLLCRPAARRQPFGTRFGVGMGGVLLNR